MTLLMDKSVLAADASKIPLLKISQYVPAINTTPPKISGSEPSAATSSTSYTGYSCLEGDRGNYQGNRPVSRYEFAAGINACTDQINRLLKSPTANFATKQDLDAVQSQLEGDRSDLDSLRNRVDRLEHFLKK
jgi:hypothetical protein